jgi:hypothetical protein
VCACVGTYGCVGQEVSVVVRGSAQQPHTPNMQLVRSRQFVLLGLAAAPQRVSNSRQLQVVAAINSQTRVCAATS